MKHRIGFNRLGRNVSHRQALYRSMATALFKYERIRTTKPKAKEIRRVAEKMISRARTDSVHNRRTIGKRIKDQAILAKLFTDIAPRFKDRPGGYTRILKLGQRYGDASEMVLLELVERAEPAPRHRKKETAKAEAEPGKGKAEPKEAPEAKPAKAKKSDGTDKGGAAETKGRGTARSAAAAESPRTEATGKKKSKARAAADAASPGDTGGDAVKADDGLKAGAAMSGEPAGTVEQAAASAEPVKDAAGQETQAPVAESSEDK